MNIEQIDKQILKCKQCHLGKNKHNTPRWTNKSKYVMFTELPYLKKPDFMIKFWELAGRFGLSEEHFIQISSIQCSPDRNSRTKRYNRPSQLHRATCKMWFESYLKEIQPKKMIAFGNIPMEELTGSFSGITDAHGTVIKPKINQVVIPTVLSLPPSILRQPDTVNLIREMLITFKEL